MQQVLRTPGAKLLYTGTFLKSISDHSRCLDTDSIIALHKKGIYPLKTGQLLGDMQREYEQWDILEYCSGGAKQYGLHLKNRQNGNEKFIIKIRVCFLPIKMFQFIFRA